MKYNETNNIKLNYYNVRNEMFEGAEHLIVPVVMLTEGVHAGSHGPLLYMAQDIQTFPEAWDGVPVVINHPEEGSANSPRVLEGPSVVGRIFNSHIDGSKLKAEAWISINKISAVNPDLLSDLQAGRPVEVSTGVYTEDEAVTGTWNGEEYIGIARNFRPDHLALLPGARGACSWEDGCGVRANQEGDTTNVTDDTTKVADNTEGSVNNSETVWTKDAFHIVHANAHGYLELREIIQAKLDAMDTAGKFHYLEDIFDDYFVYCVIIRREGATSVSKLYKMMYIVNESDGSVTFEGEPVEVIRQVEYLEQNADSTNNASTEEDNDNEGGATGMATNTQEKPCCPERVTALISNRATAFVEDDREWLSRLSENQLEKIENGAEVKQEAAKPSMNKEEAIKVLKENLSDPEQFMQFLPSEVRGSIENGLKLHRDHRAKLISTVKANTEEWTEEELGEMKTNELERISRVIKPKADYSALGGVGISAATTNDSGVAPLLPPGVVAKKD